MKISELAERVQMVPSTLRYYERIGLLPPAKRVSGRRQYDESAIERLLAIRVAKQAGWELTEIKELLNGIEGRQAFSAQWAEAAERKLTEIDAQIIQLEQMKALVLKGIACACESLTACELVQAERGG